VNAGKSAFVESVRAGNGPASLAAVPNPRTIAATLDETRTYLSRRDCLKVAIAGGAMGFAGGCRHAEQARKAPEADAGARAEPAASALSINRPRLRGEDFTHGHAKRDGVSFPRASRAESCEVVIIGGGPSGLCAAHLLADRDIVLLEKESRWGGNCSTDEWEGIPYSTGAAFYSEGDTELVELLRSVGVPGQKVHGGDSLIVGGEPYFDFFGAGANRLPFPEHVRDDFKRSFERAMHFHRHRDSDELDRLSFVDFLSPYGVELREFWQRYAASNWGGAPEHTSLRVGVQAYGWLEGTEKRLTYPGGLGVATKALARALEPKLGSRMRQRSFVHHVETDGNEVLVHAVTDGEPSLLRAKAVILAVPKFLAARLVPELPDAQREAMQGFRYSPYAVLNVCLNRRGPEPAYDNWFLDTPFADFIPADWVTYAGKGPDARKTVLTVYHPLAEPRRAELLDDARLVELSEDTVRHLTRHFPSIKEEVAEVRAFRRGHALPIPTPGQLERANVAARSHGRILFAHSDSRGDVSSLPGALRAAKEAVHAFAAVEPRAKATARAVTG